MLTERLEGAESEGLAPVSETETACARIVAWPDDVPADDVDGAAVDADDEPVDVDCAGAADRVTLSERRGQDGSFA